MVLTKEQLSELICKHSERENGLQDLLEILLESMILGAPGISPGKLRIREQMQRLPSGT